MRYPGHRLLASAIVAGMLACSGSVHAFDGERRGFLLGLAGGFHTSDTDVDDGGLDDLGSSSSGVALRLMIGGGISERFTLYAIRDFNVDSGDTVFGVTGVGSTFYFRSNGGPGAYLHGALGVGDVTYEDDRDRFDNDRYYDDIDSAYGIGISFGGGYAFTQGFHVDGSLMYVEATDDENFEVDIDYELLSLRAMAGYTWF